MITVNIPECECYDEVNNKFITFPSVKLRLEHSLISISKWESRWEIPFLSKREKTDAQLSDYIQCMSIDNNISEEVFFRIPVSEIERINTYINSKQTAIEFLDDKQSGKTLTSDMIYYWMICFNIPFECSKWHLNRLLALIKVCDIENNKHSKKRNPKELYSRNRALNEARKAKYNTKG